MNLREAIEAGSARVDRRGIGMFIRPLSDGGYAACAIGAAYLGCHPDELVGEVALDAQRVSRWVEGLTGGLSWVGRVYAINDRWTEGWGELLDRLHEQRAVGPSGRVACLDEIEVCDEPA
jgi:hypothetical protein